jgi:hypothetical protein
MMMLPLCIDTTPDERVIIDQACAAIAKAEGDVA